MLKIFTYQPKSLSQFMNPNKKFVFQTQDHVRVISNVDILFFKSDNSYTNIHLINGDEFLISKSLSKLSKEFETDRFVRVSQSYLININHVRLVNKKKKEIEMVNSFKIYFTKNIKDIIELLSQAE